MGLGLQARGVCRRVKPISPASPGTQGGSFSPKIRYLNPLRALTRRVQASGGLDAGNSSRYPDGQMFRRRNSPDANKRLLRCSFCGKGYDKGRRLVAGPGVFICDQCIHLCNEVLQSEGQHGELSIGPDSEVADVLLDDLRINAAGLKQSEDQLQRAVNLLRKNRVPWSQIGEAIGTSRQAAWERFSGED